LSLLVDSSVWIDYFTGAITPQTDHLHGILSKELILTGDLILAEVLQGFSRQQDFDRARAALLAFPVIEMVGRELAIKSAENYRTLRARGVAVRKPIDCLIATRCLEDGLTLLHSDRDFDPFEELLGLRVRHP
jgi:predicted nucleic acid-binding protein